MPFPVDRKAQDRNYVGGEWVSGGGTLTVENPSTGEVLTEVPAGGKTEIDAAVKAARAAFEEDKWRRMDAADRGALIWKLADAIEARTNELAQLEALDNGKPVREAMIDIKMTVDTFRYYAGWATKLEGETIPVRGNILNYTVREPVGVVGAIVPWNFPLLMATYKVAPALACGNTMVLKPAEQTPLSALELAALAEEVGIPRGVLNVVNGRGEDAGAALVAHPDVDKIAFTGSTAVGRVIMKSAADTLKRVSLELGGKSPNVIFEDADLEAAARGAFSGIFYNTGQCCTAGSRLIVHESIKDQLVETLRDRASKLGSGDALDPKRRFGPVVSQEQMDRVLGYIAKGRAEGATLVTGGERIGDKGYWVQPTVFDGVDPGCTIGREEIFGPVLAIMTFKDEEEAVRIANDSVYGLAGAVWTKDVKRAHRVAQRMQAGTVWINTYHPLDPASPFGGYKQSGIGRELGRHALDLYTQIKSVWVDLN